MIEKIEKILNEKGKVKIKLYSLIYSIELLNDKYIIYADYYDNNKKEYYSLLELLNCYQIYNENIIENIGRIILYE